MKILAVILPIVILSNTMAQDYRTVYSDRIAYFANLPGNVKCIRIDSVKFLSDSVLYPFSNIQQLGQNCYTPYGASWIGEKILINDSLNIFFNKNHDTIKIKTNASLNESWIAYELQDSTIITATINKIDTPTFLGLTDPVKTIGFQVYDKTMNPIDNSLNNKSIMISKNYGFVTALNFYLFPDFEITTYLPYLDESLQEYTLSGLSVPLAGISNLKWFEVNDFQAGDELHILYQASDISIGYSHSQTRKTILKYLDRINQPDSIIYSIERKQSNQVETNGNYTFEYIHDTIQSVIKPDTLFDKLPGEPIIIDSTSAYTYLTSNGFKIQPAPDLILHNGSSDTCWHIPISDGCFPEKSFVKGLGGPYYHCDNAFSAGGEDNQLVYYKKGGDTWGTPLIVTEIRQPEKENEISIYPNPAKDLIWIKTSLSNLQLTVEITDITGQIIIRKEINKIENFIRLNNYTSGIYLYKILSKDRIIKTGKLIIE